jgi:hypothetical protein
LRGKLLPYEGELLPYEGELLPYEGENPRKIPKYIYIPTLKAFKAFKASKEKGLS